jgi:hypothetical protein
MKKLCKQCRKLKRHHAKGMCEDCYMSGRNHPRRSGFCVDPEHKGEVITRLVARQLCEFCYQRNHYKKTLHRYPLVGERPVPAGTDLFRA